MNELCDCNKQDRQNIGYVIDLVVEMAKVRGTGLGGASLNLLFDVGLFFLQISPDKFYKIYMRQLQRDHSSLYLEFRGLQ